MLARAELANPDILVLDEATSGLETEAALELLAHIRATRPQAIMPLIGQSPGFAEVSCRHLTMRRAGGVARIVAERRVPSFWPRLVAAEDHLLRPRIQPAFQPRPALLSASTEFCDADAHLGRLSGACGSSNAPATCISSNGSRKPGITGKRIYHFGTGGHHYIGIRCAEPELDCTVLGITASPKEYDAFVKLAIDNPTITKSYSAYFGDIYTSNAKLLPRFDIVTLFHSCEFRSEKNDAYGALTDLEVMQLFTDQTDVGGHILFYTRFFAYETAKPIIEEWAKSRPVEEIGEFKTLRIFRKTA